ncbi:MAG: hypothetical protein QF741_02335 [Candidatus Peribacteraceae bacterium]|nr:hypothetical protein [Candidatus Peribacteraceae bacterium]MDP7454494.1 hypothetical protein [Candidatus Peribacteraceae bacterium]
MNKPIVTLGLIVILLAISTADVFFTSAKLPEVATKPQAQNQPQQRPQPRLAKKNQKAETAKAPNILEILVSEQYKFQHSDEQNLLSMIIKDGTPVQSRALIKDSDRAGFVAWSESPKVKIYFLSLKEALHVSFTPQVKDLIDETQKREGRAERNLLSFSDPGIGEERLVFVRVRNRLFEFHLAKNYEDEMFDLIEKLTK